MVEGPDKGKAARISAEQPVTIGTDAGCELALTDRTVSRRHAEIHREGSYFVVRDLRSTNGTFHQDVRIGEAYVSLGAEILFGKARVKIVPEEVPVEARPHVAERFGPLIGGDLRMREIFTLIEDISKSDVTVVVEGETGTGKELVAQAIHESSLRKNKPFVVFDCANQPKDLIESALFGHVRGAFTGATAPRAGAFQRAHEGTIFLDELGELGLDLQPKLLRVLESKEIQKVGGDGYEPVDVRVIAATNHNLRADVRAGLFREDLYYRLAVVKLTMPSLRERAADIPRLAEHFLELNGASLSIDPSCYAKLRAYGWPGNVRELRNVVDRACALARGRSQVDLFEFVLRDDDDDATGQAFAEGPKQGLAGEDGGMDLGLPFKEAKGKIVSDFESRYVAKLLREHGNNISLASREAGIDRKHFKDLMKKHGIEARSEDDEET
ncbi:MAG: sigma 54-interacting transcriptional regulator [Deltaproteobacteria bacterium]|nr:sigma 54-interacting transcriptional regulator [Deltaproteobacteria bacterium]